MSILVYAENWNGKFKKSTFEVVSYAKEIAKTLNQELNAITIGEVIEEELKKLGTYGVKKVFKCSNIEKKDDEAATNILEQIVNDSEIIIFSQSYSSQIIAARLSVRIEAGLINNIIDIPSSFSPLIVNRKTFSSKAIETVEATTKKTILSISPNSYKIVESKEDIVAENIQGIKKEKIKIIKQEATKSTISLSEAEIIVSAGRGLKNGDNWKMIEDLAALLKAATACSKPVSDMGWRPHSEHVGQTGKTVSPNLYIAIGISGAIQHLAGVNSSKVIVVINTDPEAPFFKAADYGIVGDAFEIIPKLTEEIRKIAE